ncbi:MAG: GGDEF domain-containing phosphodiesterase [Lachnospiraceae bacterium]|nr:GGDEF domain-containing phosphodiesterase [Lachnospiraceae bacterium]
MFINKLNQLYKPKRLLFYTEATDEEIRDFYAETVPERINRYSGAFGTYDYPGVFFVRSLEREVIGIEYRADDDRIDYPKDLKSISLDGSFFYSVEIDSGMDMSLDSIRGFFEKIALDDDAHRNYTDLSIKKRADAGVISVFTGCKKIRMLYEWKLDRDMAQSIIDDDVSAFGSEMLYKTSFFDPITGHYNWNHLVSYLEMPMDKGINDYAFVHFDVKEFRVLNEVYGHIAANKVLSNIVKAMNEADFVYASARCHNDNFAMMIKDMPREETIRTLDRFFDELSHLEEDPNYKIFYRCGVVPMQRSILSGNRVADAGKMAQALGTNRSETDIIIYTDKMHDDISWSNYIKAYLETAIENDEFVVYLQPKIKVTAAPAFSAGSDAHAAAPAFSAGDPVRGELEGAEALIRWNYKGEEFLSPARFIPYFEKDCSIGKIDDIVLKKVCMALKKWEKAGRKLVPISVNLSRSRLYSNNIIEHLTNIVDEYGVDHKYIDFELTESASYDNKKHMIRVMEELQKRGFKISMDDFGTGYSSLSLLTELPFDTLKIDKSFVDKVAAANEKKEDIILLKHIIILAKELGLNCLAEGAENADQVKKLVELGCDVIQGYYFSKPISISDFEQRFL